MLKHSRWLLLAIVVLAGVAACGGGAEIGEACDEEASAGECVDDAACAKAQSGALQCMRVCKEQADCPETAECTGTKGSIKVCQPKTG